MPKVVVQVAHTRVKSPKSMLDGTPLVLLTLGTYVSVAASPDQLFNVRAPSRLNPVPAVPVAFVVYVMVPALALAASRKTTNVVMIIPLLLIFCPSPFSVCSCNQLQCELLACAHVNET